MGLSLLTASPAAASINWEPVDTNSTWKCGPTKQHTAVPGVGFQACMVFGTGSKSTWAAGWLVVTNNSGKAISLEGTVKQTWDDGLLTPCETSVLNSGFTRGCPSSQRKIECGRNTVYGDLRVNGVWNRSASKHHDWNPSIGALCL